MSTLLSPGFDPLDSGLHLGLRRERRTWRRQLSMGILLALFVGIIWGYWTITDSDRVKAMAETELSKMVGGRVRVGAASLSIFDGLRLNDVEVHVDERWREDSKIFTAESLLVRVNLQALLHGKFEPRQIMAVRPQVFLCENLDVGGDQRWNFRRLTPAKGDPATRPTTERPVPRILPEFLLRAGRVEYTRIVGGRPQKTGELFIDGQVTPRGHHIYRFDFESRAEYEAVGPRLRGYLDMGRKVVMAGFQVDSSGSISGYEKHARTIQEIIADSRAFQGGMFKDNIFPLVDGFEFGHAIRAMLPAEVQEWWARHQLAGRVRIPRFFYQWNDGAEPVYQIEVDLDAVQLGIPGEELLGAREFARLQNRHPGPSLAEFPGLSTMLAMGVQGVTGPGSLVLNNVTGRFTFTQDRIRFSNIAGRFENNTIIASGVIRDYSVEAPMDIQLAAPDVRVPAIPLVLASVPREVRKLHSEIQPAGIGSVTVGIAREIKGGPVDYGLELRLKDGSFCFHEFPYPLERATGIVRFGRERLTGFERVELVNIRGYGAAGSLNADRALTVNGFVAPLDRRNKIEIDINGDGIWLDSAVRRALPLDAREVIGRFDTRLPDGVIKPAQIFGGFAARARRELGYGKKISVHVDLDVADASGAFEAFPYPLEKMRGKVLIRSNHAEVRDLVARQGSATLMLDGTFSWGNGRPPEPDLRIRATDVPIDDTLLAAIPAEQSEWIRKTGIGGVIDVDGRIFLGQDPITVGDPKPREGLRVASPRSEVRWDLGMTVRNGKIWAIPGTKTYAVTGATAQLRLTDTDLTIASVRGKRGPAQVSGDGYFAWGGGEDRMRLDFLATALPLDKTLYQVIPAGARSAWDELRPSNAVIDLAVHWDAGAITAGAIGAAPTPKHEDSYSVTIIPRGGSVLPKTVPWRLDNVAGKAVISPGRVDLVELTASHGPANVKIDGTATDIPGGSEWRLRVNAANIVADEEFLSAVPAGVASVMTGIEYKGSLSIDCPTFTYRSLDPPASSAATQPVKVSADEYDFQSTVTLHDAAMNLGIPVTNAEGTIGFSATIRKGELDSLAGKMELPSLLLAGRPARNFRTNILKPAGDTKYLFDQLQGKFAGGDMAGQVALDVPSTDDPSRYVMALALHGCDIKLLAGEMDEKMKGRLSASLAMEGSWSDINNRRGRGDIQVQGEQLYRIPVVLGLLQITNLSLPIKSPFTDASTAYSIEGQRVTFESISLRAKDMLMQGSGYLDFGSKKVSLSFTTDNPNWPKIPIIDDILEGAKRELLQIHIRGTVEEPKVGARLMNTVSTTVDEVFKGKPPAEKKNGKRK